MQQKPEIFLEADTLILEGGGTDPGKVFEREAGYDPRLRRLRAIKCMQPIFLLAPKVTCQTSRGYQPRSA
jgi:hypothetical protein